MVNADAGAEPQGGAQPLAMFKRLFGYPSSSKKAAASTSTSRSLASAPASASASASTSTSRSLASASASASAPKALPGDDADRGRALFDALLAEPRLTSAKLTGSFVPKLTAHPARVPPDLEKALRATLASHLNDPDADDDRVREACLHLLSTLALEPSNADFVLAALRDLDRVFECAFEREELYADAPPASSAPSSSSASSSRGPHTHPRQLHAHILRALLRCLGDQFTAFDLLEMSRDRADLAVVAALECVESASPPHAPRPDPGDLPQLRARACRLLHELTTPDAHFAAGERDAGIASLAAHFKRRCGDVLRAALEANALERLTKTLAPASASDASASDENRDAEDAVRADAASAAIRAVRNMLLYSDERSAQLRKAMTRSHLARRVLEPFLERAVHRAAEEEDDEDDDSTTTAIRHAREALSAFVAATYKTGTLRQRFLVDPQEASSRTSVPGGILAEPSLASSLAVVDALCRLACNLRRAGAGGGDVAAEGRARWRRARGDARSTGRRVGACSPRGSPRRFGRSRRIDREDERVDRGDVARRHGGEGGGGRGDARRRGRRSAAAAATTKGRGWRRSWREGRRRRNGEAHGDERKKERRETAATKT